MDRRECGGHRGRSGDQQEFCTAMGPVKKNRKEQREGFSNIREDRRDGFVQKSKRKTRQHLERTDGPTSASWSNRFDVLKRTEGELEVEEVNAVDVVQEIVEITLERMPETKEWRLAAVQFMWEEKRDWNL